MKFKYLLLLLYLVPVFAQSQAGYGLYGSGLSIDTSIVCDKTVGCVFLPGATVTLQPSTTNSGLVILCAPLPSQPTSGSVALDPNCNINSYNGTNWQLYSWLDSNVLNAQPGLPIVLEGSNELNVGTVTGSGSFVLASTPTLINPIVTSYINMNHDHSTTAAGGPLSVMAFNGGLNASSSTSLHGDGTWQLALPTVLSSQWSFTTNDVISTDGAVYDGVTSVKSCNGACSTTAFAKTYTIPANTLGLNNVYRVTLTFVSTRPASTPISTITLNLGSNPCFSSSNVQFVASTNSNVGSSLVFFISGTTSPNSNAVVDCEVVGASSMSQSYTGNYIFAPVFDTTQPLPITFTIKYNTALPGAMTGLRSMVVEQIN